MNRDSSDECKCYSCAIEQEKAEGLESCNTIGNFLIAGTAVLAVIMLLIGTFLVEHVLP